MTEEKSLFDCWWGKVALSYYMQLINLIVGALITVLVYERLNPQVLEQHVLFTFPMTFERFLGACVFAVATITITSTMGWVFITVLFFILRKGYTLIKKNGTIKEE